MNLIHSELVQMQNIIYETNFTFFNSQHKMNNYEQQFSLIHHSSENIINFHPNKHYIVFDNIALCNVFRTRKSFETYFALQIFTYYKRLSQLIFDEIWWRNNICCNLIRSDFYGLYITLNNMVQLLISGSPENIMITYIDSLFFCVNWN